MRLRSDDYKGIPLFYMLFCEEHKIGSFYTKSGYQKRLQELSTLIAKDMNNIDSFIKRWKEMYPPNITNWEGESIERN